MRKAGGLSFYYILAQYFLYTAAGGYGLLLLQERLSSLPKCPIAQLSPPPQIRQRCFPEIFQCWGMHMFSIEFLLFTFCVSYLISLGTYINIVIPRIFFLCGLYGVFNNSINIQIKARHIRCRSPCDAQPQSIANQLWGITCMSSFQQHGIHMGEQGYPY